MKILLAVLISLALGSIGFGQSVMSIPELKRLNAKANWVKVNEKAETGEPIYIDANDIEREDMLVFFRVKMVLELAGTSYTVVAGSCATSKYVFNNMFYTLPNGQYNKVGVGDDSEVIEAKRGDMMYSALYYACNYRPASIPTSNREL